MFSISVKEIKEFLRDYSNVFFYIAFPILLVFLLGTLLGEADKADSPIGEIKLHYRLENTSLAEKEIIESFMEGLGKDATVIPEEVLDTTESKELLGRGELDCYVVFSGAPFQITIFQGNNSIKNRTVKSILHSFVYGKETISMIGEKQTEQSVMIDYSKSYLEQKDLGTNRSMIDYYAVTMLVMISLMSMIIGAGVFMVERDYKTFPRLLLSPKKRMNIFFQKILGVIPQLLIQQIIIMAFSSFVYGASYGATKRTVLFLFLMMMIVTFTMVSLGAIVGLLINMNPIVTIMPVTWIMMFFGGTYSKDVFIDGLTQWMPPYLIQQAAFDLTVFGHMDKASKVMGVCGVLTVLALMLGSYIFQRREEV